MSAEAEPHADAWGWRRPGRTGGAVYWVILALSAAGLLIVLNQTFNLGAFGFRPVSNAYYYCLIAIFLALAFLTHPARAGDETRVPWYDWLLAGATLAVGVYFALHAETIITQGWDLFAPTTPTVLSAVLVLLALEGVRRAGGLALFVLCAVFAVYPMFAGHMPGVLWGTQLSAAETVSAHAMGVESIIGIPMRVVADLLIGFIVFGVALVVTGGGAFFMDLATALMGGTRGGPAKVSILASGFFGSLSGSVISNVITTGNLTIPTMKRSGYPATYAGAVEACASTGGALMPPVMGAVAFIMASFLNTSYAAVMVAATVPALLFYVALLLQADNFAARKGLRGLPRDQIPPLGATLRGGWYYLFSLFALVYMLLVVRIERVAPWYATAVLVVCALAFRRGRRRGVMLLDLVAESGTAVANLVAILAGVGLIVGTLSVTGVGNAFSRELIQYAGGSVLLLLVLGALTSFILGMGMTVSACYIFLAIVLAPALASAGLHPMASHLFILYWGMLSYITPPVALAAVAAASIAGASAMATGVQAIRLGAVLFVLPFLFVFNPALILDASGVQIATAVPTALVAVWLLASASERYLYGIGRLALWQVALVLVAAITLMVPEHRTDVAGAVIVAGVYLHGWLLRRRGAA